MVDVGLQIPGKTISKIAKRRMKESEQRRIKSNNELLMEQNVLFLIYHVENVLHWFCTCPFMG